MNNNDKFTKKQILGLILVCVSLVSIIGGTYEFIKLKNAPPKPSPSSEQDIKNDIFSAARQAHEDNDPNMRTLREMSLRAPLYMSAAYQKETEDKELASFIDGYNRLHETVHYDEHLYNETVTMMNLKHKPQIAIEQFCIKTDNLHVVNYNTKEDVTYKYQTLEGNRFGIKFLRVSHYKGTSHWELITHDEMLQYYKDLDNEKTKVTC